MIYEMRHMPPFIQFETGNSTFTGRQGEITTIWLKTLYNRAAYTFTLLATGAAVIKISDYEYQISYQDKGSYKIQLTVQGKEKPVVPTVPEVPENPKPGPETQPKSTDSIASHAETQTPPPAIHTPVVLQSNILEVIIT